MAQHVIFPAYPCIPARSGAVSHTDCESQEGCCSVQWLQGAVTWLWGRGLSALRLWPAWRLCIEVLPRAILACTALAKRGHSCEAPLEPVLDLPRWRLPRGEDEDGASLQVPLLRRVVAA